MELYVGIVGYEIRDPNRVPQPRLRVAQIDLINAGEYSRASTLFGSVCIASQKLDFGAVRGALVLAHDAEAHVPRLCPRIDADGRIRTLRAHPGCGPAEQSREQI